MHGQKLKNSLWLQTSVIAGMSEFFPVCMSVMSRIHNESNIMDHNFACHYDEETFLVPSPVVSTTKSWKPLPI